MNVLDRLKGGIYGGATADALGVPVEFQSRELLKIDSVVDMRSYGSWNQPMGTWSDDSSLTFCLMEALCKGYDLESMGQLFVKWYKEGHWGAHYETFDIGGSTKNALNRIINGTSAEFSGNLSEDDNGNGSLMRILPLAFYLKDKEIAEIYTVVKQVSSITHAHFRSCFACLIYVVYAIYLIRGMNKVTAYVKMKKEVMDFAKVKEFNIQEVALFERVLEKDIQLLGEKSIKSGGYVLHSLEASFWCFLSTGSYKEAVLKAVNLGDDTDTTGAITGGLAGVYYGIEEIPVGWRNVLVRNEDIAELIQQFYQELKS